jgi:hypothetical protein
VKEVKIGWSWPLFLFSGFFGLPLFLRQLHVWGAIYIALWVVFLVILSIEPGEARVIFVLPLYIVMFGLQNFVAIKGNEMTAKNYLEKGWTFVEPDSKQTKMAKMRWGITV